MEHIDALSILKTGLMGLPFGSSGPQLILPTNTNEIIPSHPNSNSK